MRNYNRTKYQNTLNHTVNTVAFSYEPLNPQHIV